MVFVLKMQSGERYPRGEDQRHHRFLLVVVSDTVSVAGVLHAFSAATISIFRYYKFIQQWINHISVLSHDFFVNKSLMSH